MEGEVFNAMEGLITMATPMLTLSWAQVVTVVETIVSDPLLFLTVAFLIAGGIVGIFGRILGRR